MKPVPRFAVTVEKGKMTIHDREGLAGYLSNLIGDYWLTITRTKKKRSDAQNRYYWGVVVPIAANHFGYDHEEMHEAFKYRFLRREEPGKPLTIGSTKKMTTSEFVEYIDNVIVWLATEFGVTVPPPNQIEIN